MWMPHFFFYPEEEEEEAGVGPQQMVRRRIPFRRNPRCPGGPFPCAI